jgi:hypothetical protein
MFDYDRAPLSDDKRLGVTALAYSAQEVDYRRGAHIKIFHNCYLRAPTFVHALPRRAIEVA